MAEKASEPRAGFWHPLVSILGTTVRPLERDGPEVFEEGQKPVS